MPLQHMPHQQYMMLILKITFLKGSENAFSSRWKGQRLKDRRDMMTQVYIASLRGEKPSPPDTDDDEYKPSMGFTGIRFRS